MQFGYEFLTDRLPPGRLRILEVGAGLGLLSIFLHKRGHSVVALEPSTLAFDFFHLAKEEIKKRVGKDDLPRMIDKSAEQLTIEDGEFDFIFSINVMEHVKELDLAFEAITRVLHPEGQWVNSCPNYYFPYEPHYGIILIPFFLACHINSSENQLIES